MNVFLLYNDTDDYEGGPTLYHVYATRELAESELPRARWIEADPENFDVAGAIRQAMHPIYDVEWESPQFNKPFIVEETVVDLIISGPEVPKGPEFGPPLPRTCRYRDQSSWQLCTRFDGHDGPHHLVEGMWTGDGLLFTSTGTIRELK